MFPCRGFCGSLSEKVLGCFSVPLLCLVVEWAELTWWVTSITFTIQWAGKSSLDMMPSLIRQCRQKEKETDWDIKPDYDEIQSIVKWKPNLFCARTLHQSFSTSLSHLGFFKYFYGLRGFNSVCLYLSNAIYKNKCWKGELKDINIFCGWDLAQLGCR